MSLNNAMLTGISGLTTNAASLAVISDNIANVNTPAFKRSSAEFANMIASSGSRKGIFFGGGVTGTTRQYISLQGNSQRTSSSTDMAIAGSGFFMVAKTSNDPVNSDPRTFTRVGNFTTDNAGYLKGSNGQYLLGWPVDNTGAIDFDPTDITKLRPINVSSATGTASPTTTVAISANLKSSQTLSGPSTTIALQAAAVTAAAAAAAAPANAALAAASTAATNAAVAAALVYPPYNAATNNMSMYAADPDTGVQPDFDLQISVADSKGGQRNLTIAFLRSAEPNTWYAELRGASADFDPVANPNGLISSGLVRFNPDGSLDMANTDLFGAPGSDTITIGASAATTGSRFVTGLGVAAQTINFDLSNKFTQTDNVSQLISQSANGTAFGNQVSIEVDEKGFVSAVFDNGSIRQLSQIAVATFTNPDGLNAGSGGLYTASSTSGNYILSTAGSTGVGKIQGSNLEGSNVDLSLEFTGLITTQRAYSASSKIITTSDQMLDELISIKR
jgi:flagellar hook protein FlgE